MKTNNINVIALSDWDQLVKYTYGRPYSFQQQDGCRGRELFKFSIPAKDAEDYPADKVIAEVVNGEEMGVAFAAWLERDPKQGLKDEPGRTGRGEIDFWWKRNFYPDFLTIANDLHKRGLLPAGDYGIDIDW